VLRYLPYPFNLPFSPFVPPAAQSYNERRQYPPIALNFPRVGSFYPKPCRRIPSARVVTQYTVHVFFSFRCLLLSFFFGFKPRACFQACSKCFVILAFRVRAFPDCWGIVRGSTGSHGCPGFIGLAFSSRLGPLFPRRCRQPRALSLQVLGQHLSCRVRRSPKNPAGTSNAKDLRCVGPCPISPSFFGVETDTSWGYPPFSSPAFGPLTENPHRETFPTPFKPCFTPCFSSLWNFAPTHFLPVSTCPGSDSLFFTFSPPLLGSPPKERTLF